MANYPLPVKNTAFIFYGCLVQQADTRLFKSVPTLAAGDFKVSIDGGAFANLATLPTNTPGTFSLKISLSVGEMNGDNILVVASDVAGAEWCDQSWSIQTATRGVDDLAYPATSGRSMVVDASGLVDANTVKVGPTGAGTAQTAGDIVATEVLVKAKTDNLPASPAAVGSNMGTVTSVTGAVGSVTGNVGGNVVGNVNGNVVGSVGSVVGAVGSVTAGVSLLSTGLDLVLVADLAAVPAANGKLTDAVSLLFMAQRNLWTETSSQGKLYKDDGTTVMGTSAKSDDGTTFTSAKLT